MLSDPAAVGELARSNRLPNGTFPWPLDLPLDLPLALGPWPLALGPWSLDLGPSLGVRAGW